MHCDRNLLKIIAMVTMVIDHIGCVFVPRVSEYPLYLALRMIGRISFPLFCFLLVEGFETTRSLKRYLARIGMFALISEIPFDLAFYGSIWELQHQNVMFTLLLALVTLAGVRYFAMAGYAQVAVILAGCVAAEFIHCDYGMWGILLPVVCYIYRDRAFLRYFWMAVLQLHGRIQSAAILAIPLLMLYRPQETKWRFPKYFFYAFYPAHLLVIWIVDVVI